MPILLLVWFIANFVPHIIVFIATGKIYYQLAAIWMIVAENTIMLLNLLLPLIALRYLLNQRDHILQNLCWRWRGWRTIWIGLAGFIATIIMLLCTQQIIGDPVGSPAKQIHPGEVLIMLLSLLVLAAASEEMMFRGYIQTVLTRDYGAWVGVIGTALLFGLRHLPMDLYNGLVTYAPLSSWVSRMLQLYIGALLFGIARHWAKSNWASWIMHEGVVILIVILSIVASG